MTLVQIVLLASAFAYGGIAVTFLADPATMAALVDVSLGGATADNDVRAVYGGTALGLTAFLLASVHRPDWHRPALWMVALTLGSMAAARFLSILLVGPPRPIGFLLHGAELLGFGFAIVALRSLRRKS
jgi:hypothetical protein